jgi:hypothetical protein
MKAWLTNHKLDEMVWEVLLAFNLGQPFEQGVHYTAEYHRDGVMKTPFVLRSYEWSRPGLRFCHQRNCHQPDKKGRLHGPDLPRVRLGSRS